MIDGNIHTQVERIGAFELQWTNRVDAAGSRIEWSIATDTQGWVSRYGPVHNQGMLFGSRAIGGYADEQTLLGELRSRVRAMAANQGAGGQILRAA
jgi:hypothetical protein